MNDMPYLIVVGAAVVALAALAALASHAVSIVRGVREMRRADSPPRSPPLPEEIAKCYATKLEIAELRQELKDERRRVDGIFQEQFAMIRKLDADAGRRMERLEASIASWQKGVDNWQLGIERMIGRIEGKVEEK